MNNNINAIIGQRIKERRLNKKLSMSQLADRVGVARTTISRYESGNIENIPMAILESLSRSLDCSVSYLIGKTEDPEKKIDYVNIGVTDFKDVNKLIQYVQNYIYANSMELTYRGEYLDKKDLEIITKKLDEMDKLLNANKMLKVI